jgi:hypothetical protein
VISGAYGAISESVPPATNRRTVASGPLENISRACRTFLKNSTSSRPIGQEIVDLFVDRPWRARLKPHWARKTAALRDALKQRQAYGRQSRRRALSAHRQRSADLRARAATDKPQKESHHVPTCNPNCGISHLVPCASRSELLENTARALSHCSELLAPPSNRLNLAVNFSDGFCRFFSCALTCLNSELEPRGGEPHLARWSTGLRFDRRMKAVRREMAEVTCGDCGRAPRCNALRDAMQSARIGVRI